MPATDGTETIAFLGGGHMARALAAGLLRQGRSGADIRIGEPLEATRMLAQALGVQVSPDNRAALAGASLVVLAVKPQDAPAALQSMHAAALAPDALLLSVVAGLAVADLTRLAPPGLAVVRAMPNRPALVGAGITALYAGRELAARGRQRAEAIVRAAGDVVWVGNEPDLDVVTALSGSGPAYFFLLAEQLAQAAQQLGLAADTATRLAIGTLYGTGLLARHAAERGSALADERQAVTSRGGTTEAALAVLREGGFEALVARALGAAARRSAELGARLSGQTPRTAGHS